MDAKEIRNKITSKNPDILKGSILFVNERLSLLRERAKVAETRATTILALSSILVGFVVHLGKTFGNLEISDSVLSVSLYLAAIFFIFKSIFYSIKTLWVLKKNELNTDLIYEFQKCSEIESLREELTWKIWEFWELIPVSTEKLFWLNRSQRNTVAALITYMFLGMILFLEMKLDISINFVPTYLLVSMLVVLGLFIDPAMERLGNIWNKCNIKECNQANSADAKSSTDD